MSVCTAVALLGAAAIACAPTASAATDSAAHPAAVRQQPAVAGHPAPLINQPYWEVATGYGATLGDAESDAEDILNGGCTYGTNGIPHMVSNGQEPDGSWWATMKAYCSYE
jgi:hypothetical protein